MKSGARSLAVLLTLSIACGGPSTRRGDRGAEDVRIDSGPSVAEVFETGVISAGNVYRGAFTPDGRELYYFKKIGRDMSEDYRIFRSARRGNAWSAPERVALGGDHADLYPAISPDGRRMVFSSYRPVPGDTARRPNAYLWCVERQGDGWGRPVFMTGANVLGSYHAQPSFGPAGALYFKRISTDWNTTEQWVTRWGGRGYHRLEPYEAYERWRTWRSDRRVWEATPAPDDSYALLTVSTLDSSGRALPADLWVSHRRGGGWSEPRPLGAGVNSPGTENFPFFSPDGTVLYFVRDFRAFFRVSVAAALRAPS